MPLSEPEQLSDSHDLSRFSCGNPALDNWLKTRALSNARRGFTAVIVVHDAGRVVGYYGLAPTAIPPFSVPRSIRTGQPPDPIPCLLIGQLAIDQQWRGQRVGAGLLKHALYRCLQAADLIGGRLVLVSAVDDDAVAFWQRHKFIQSVDNSQILLRSMGDIRTSLGAAK